MSFKLTRNVKSEKSKADWRYEYQDGLDRVEGELTREGGSWIHEVAFSTVDARLQAICAKIHTEVLRLYHTKKCKRGELMALHFLCAAYCR